MLQSFVDFCYQTFPSISDDAHDALKKAIQEMQSKTLNYRLVADPIQESMFAQGDIFDRVYFSYVGKEGQLIEEIIPGILLTNTCDNERKKNLLFAPLFKISDLFEKENDIKQLKSNQKFSVMYLNEVSISDMFVDFNIISAVNREWFCSMVKSEKSKRLLSLSQIGYYFFILKLTIYLMRYEDKHVNQSRLM